VFISHGHPDHCADLNPLLRARALRDDPPAPLPVYALPGALDAVLALDRPGMLNNAYSLYEFTAGGRLDIGPSTPRPGSRRRLAVRPMRSRATSGNWMYGSSVRTGGVDLLD